MKIAVVVVTYNRLELLKQVVNAFDQQTSQPEYLIIVDNCSTDGTYEYLERWKTNSTSKQEKIVIHSEKNLGGSGGFYVGTKKAVEVGADWVWVSDDDAVPDINAIKNSRRHIEGLKTPDKVSAICGEILTDGEIATSNRNYRIKDFFRYTLQDVPMIEYSKECFEVNCFSYVGVLMNTKALKKVGLIHQEYFIWLDDVEHSWRLNKIGKIYCFPDIQVDHRANKADYGLISWKSFYGYRNDLLMLKEHASKRYYIFKMARIFFRGVKSRNKTFYTICVRAIKAADRGETGVCKYYLPGSKL